jgi:hypothetical protein
MAHGCLKIEFGKLPRIPPHPEEARSAVSKDGQRVMGLHGSRRTLRVLLTMRREWGGPLTIRLSRSFAAFSARQRWFLGGVSFSSPARQFAISRGVILSEEEVLAFVHSELGSLWALELLLFLKGHEQKAFRLEQLVVQLRSSSTAVTQALTRLNRCGLADVNPDGTYRFAPHSPRHREVAAAIEALSTHKPMAVIKAIAELPDEKLRNFSDAFKFRDQS